MVISQSFSLCSGLLHNKAEIASDYKRTQAKPRPPSCYSERVHRNSIHTLSQRKPDHNSRPPSRYGGRVHRNYDSFIPSTSINLTTTDTSATNGGRSKSMISRWSSQHQPAGSPPPDGCHNLEQEANPEKPSTPVPPNRFHLHCYSHEIW